MSQYLGKQFDIMCLLGTMTCYNRAVLANNMEEANVAKQDCETMAKIISQLGQNYNPEIRLREYRLADNTVVNLYDHVFINGLRYTTNA